MFPVKIGWLYFRGIVKCIPSLNGRGNKVLFKVLKKEIKRKNQMEMRVLDFYL